MWRGKGERISNARIRGTMKKEKTQETRLRWYREVMEKVTRKEHWIRK